jgi:hypothetical protein
MHARWLMPVIVLVPAAALVAAAAAGASGSWRMILALWFVLICPGVSLIRVLGLRDRFVELALIAPLSLSIVTLTSAALFYGGVWSPDLELGLLLGLCLAGLIWSHFGSRHSVKGDA